MAEMFFLISILKPQFPIIISIIYVHCLLSFCNALNEHQMVHSICLLRAGEALCLLCKGAGCCILICLFAPS